MRRRRRKKRRKKRRSRRKRRKKRRKKRRRKKKHGNAQKSKWENTVHKEKEKGCSCSKRQKAKCTWAPKYLYYIHTCMYM